MSSTIKLDIHDYAGYREHMRHDHGLRGVVVFGRGRHRVHKTDPFGRISTHSVFDKVDYIGENIVPIGGYQFAFDKLFNIGLDQESTLRVGDLNDEAPMMRIGVPISEYQSIYYNGETSVGMNAEVPTQAGVNIPAMNFVFGFMIGHGAVRQDDTKPIAPDYKNRTLYRAIPFRVIDPSTTEIEEGMYFGKAQSQSINGTNLESYYVKKFDAPDPHIVHSWVSEDVKELQIVDDTVFATTSSMAIESYVEINFSISSKDTREYFRQQDASPKVNEFALVSGWYNNEYKDYESIRLFTKFTRPSITLDGEDKIEGIYRLYAR